MSVKNAPEYQAFTRLKGLIGTGCCISLPKDSNQGSDEGSR